MDTQKTSNLFQVFLRLRPPPSSSPPGNSDRFLSVERAEPDDPPTHITLTPPADRRRATEKFAFTRVFEEEASQLDVFHCAGVAGLVEGVVAPVGGWGTDGLVATLGVTGSGKSHTILGSRSQKGLTQLALDVLFRSLGSNLVDPNVSPDLEASLQASDPSEASIVCASSFLDSMFADPLSQSRGAGSRAGTPAMVGSPLKSSRSHPSLTSLTSHASLYRVTPHLCLSPHKTPSRSPKSIRLVDEASQLQHTPGLPPLSRNPVPSTPRAKHYMGTTTATRVKKVTKTEPKDPSSSTNRRPHPLPTLPTTPDISGVNVSADPAAEYAIVISMHEVYNDRIFDLLTPPVRSTATKEFRRRPLVFKSTEASPDRKVVAGLKKVVCGNVREALMVVEAGLCERRVAGTGANSVSSRSHGFICVEVRKRQKGRDGRGRKGGGKEEAWGGSTLTVVDLAGSERARDAKTQGATLAEAGKINESLMYLGQCLQMQSDGGNSSKPSVVPFRQCKLTELLFTNSFPSPSSSHRRNPQRAVMIVTADPLGDYNATSQILRYSALAREVTVPRATSALANHPTPGPNRHSGHSRQGSNPSNHRYTPTPGPYPVSPTLSRDGGYFSDTGSQRTVISFAGSEDRATMELAALEIARLTEEVEALRREAAREAEARAVAEAHLLTLEDRMVELEEIIREDCAAEFEKRLEDEVSRWKACLAAEVEKGEEHWDRKVELLERGLVGVEVEDKNTGAGEDKENVLVEDGGEEVERLRRENAVLRRELAGRSPTRRVPLREREDVLQGEVEGLSGRMQRLAVGEGKRERKVRRLPAKRWEDAAEADDF